MTEVAQSREELILSCVKLARLIARKFFNRWHRKFPLDEAESVCFISLIQAADNFDPSRGFKFTTLAGSYMNFSLLSYVTEKKQAGLAGAQRDQRLTKHIRFVDLTKPLKESGEEPSSLIDLLPDPSPDPESLIIDDPLRLAAQLAEHAWLTKHQRKVVAAILFNGGSILKAAKELGVTHQAVRQTFNFALPELRKADRKGLRPSPKLRPTVEKQCSYATLRLGASALRFYASTGTADWWIWPGRREAA